MAEEGKHTIYDSSLTWEENKCVMRQRWESQDWPSNLTWTERRLFVDVMEQIGVENQQKKREKQERARTIKKNLLKHHFFWERLKTVWLNLYPDERVHILQLLQNEEWTDSTLARVRQIIENAQFFAGMSEKVGAREKMQKLSSEELDLILDLPDEAIWDELLDLYRKMK